MSRKNKPTLVYIYCSGHSGSTLLNYLLNGHSKMLGLSEIDYIDRHIINKDEYVANPIDEPFWQNVRQCYEQQTGLEFDAINIYMPHKNSQQDFIKEWELMNNALLDCIYQVSDSKILVDSSKRAKRLRLLHATNHFNIKVIILIRNGLGVSNSNYQIYGNYPKAILDWMRPYLGWMFDLHKEFEREDVMWLKYEDFVTDTQAQMQNVCKFIGVDYEPDMLNYRKHEYVGIGGNQKFLSKEKQEIQLDEKWRQQLPKYYQYLFQLSGGWLNRRLGYK